MRVLVTGAGGLAGRGIARTLAKEGHDVVAQWRTRPLVRLDLDSITPWHADLTETSEYPDGLDAVVHAAACSPVSGEEPPSMAAMIRDNAVATARLAEHAGRLGARFVLLSATAVHGPIKKPVVTPTTPIRDPDGFGLTKRAAELAVSDAVPAALILRIPGIVGRGRSRNWVAATADRLASGRKVKIFNAEAPFNNAVHAADLAGFVATYLASRIPGHHAVPVGAGDPIPVRAVVETLARALDAEPRIEERAGSRPSYSIDIEPARRLGFDPMSTTETLLRFGREVRESRSA